MWSVLRHVKSGTKIAWGSQVKRLGLYVGFTAIILGSFHLSYRLTMDRLQDNTGRDEPPFKDGFGAKQQGEQNQTIITSPNAGRSGINEPHTEDGSDANQQSEPHNQTTITAGKGNAGKENATTQWQTLPSSHNTTIPLRLPASLPMKYTFRNHTGKSFSVDQSLLKTMGLPPSKGFFDLSHKTKHEVVFVTANSWTHYPESLDSIASVQKHFPHCKILYYDWGLAPWQIARLKAMCNVEYRPFNISQFNIPKLHEFRAKYQILKPLLIATVLNEYPGIVYMDSSVRILSDNIKNVQRVAIQNGGFVMITGTPDSVWAVTDAGMYEYLPTDTEALKTVHCLQSGALLLYNTEYVFKNILWYWYLCALDIHCVAPVDNLNCTLPKNRMTMSRGCHRYDQSALNILAANLYDFQMLKYHFPQHIQPAFLNVWRHPTHMYNITFCRPKSR